MRIDMGKGTPIWVSTRADNNGVTIAQGRSHIVISAEELPHLLHAITDVSGYSEAQTPAKIQKRYRMG